MRGRRTPSTVEAPTGCSIFPVKLQRRARRSAEQRFLDIRYWNEPEGADIGRIRSARAVDPRLIVVIEEDASTIGVGIGSFDGYRGMLRRVALTEEWLTLGLGSWLAAELERRLLQRGARLLRVHVHDAETRRFWERQGYSPIELSYLGKDPYREAEPVSDGASARADSWSRNGYEISTERARLDLGVVHGFLRESYWATGIPRDVPRAGARALICFGLYDAEGGQCGFARVVTDRATAALLCDMFVLESHRGRGLGKWLVECALTHPALGGLRRWSLATLDAQGLYGQFGFTPLERPTDHMVIERSPTELCPRGR